MIRLPRYLDESKLRDLAEYLELDQAGSISVERSSSTGRSRRAGLSRGVELGAGTDRSEQVTESFQRQQGVVHTLNGVVDGLEQDELLVQALEGDDLPTVSQRALVELSGELRMHAASEIAQYFDLMLPLLTEHGDADDIPVERIVSGAISPGGRTAPLVFTMDRDCESDPSLAMVMHPRWLRDADADDLEGPCTVFGAVDRMVSEGRTLSLKRYVVPQVSRAIRRALEGSAMDDLVGKLSDLSGEDYDLDDLVLEGPALLISPVAVYS